MSNSCNSYRKILLENQRSLANNAYPDDNPFIFYRIRFYIALILFVCYMLFDSLGLEFKNVDSKQILYLLQNDTIISTLLQII